MHGHQRDAVGEHIVHLPGYAAALGGLCLRDPGALLGLGGLGPLHPGAHEGASRADGVPDRDDDAHDEHVDEALGPQRQRVGPGLGVDDARGEEAGSHGERAHREDLAPPLTGGQGRQGDGLRAGGHRRRSGQQRGDGRDGDGPAPAEQQAPRGDQAEQRVDEDEPQSSPGLRLVVGVGDDERRGEAPEDQPQQQREADAPRGVPPRQAVGEPLVEGRCGGHDPTVGGGGAARYPPQVAHRLLTPLPRSGVRSRPGGDAPFASRDASLGT